jgi:nucleotide-binding universal stress UspA family protein
VLAHAAADQRMRHEELAASTAEQRLASGDQYARARSVKTAREHTHSMHPYRAILDCAQRSACDLIVMASHGRSGTAAMVLASETLKVLTRANVPVLVVR